MIGLIEFAIGAEGTRSLDFLAPAVFAASDMKVPRVIYFEDTSHNEFHNNEVVESLDGFLGLSAEEWLNIAPKDVRKAAALDESPNAAFVVETYLRASGFQDRFIVVDQLPSADQLSRAIARSLDIDLLPTEVHFRQSRTCLRLAGGSAHDFIEKAEFTGNREISLITQRGRKVQGGEKIICQGDYAILKTLVYGRPAYVPWYQKPNPESGQVAFEASEVFTPLYSARINRRSAMHTHDLKKPLAYGYFWNFEEPGMNSDVVDRARAWEPCNLTKRICELIASPQREVTVRRRAAHDVVEGLITSATISVQDFLSLAKSGESPVDVGTGKKLFQIIALLKAGRDLRKAFQTGELGESLVSLLEKQTSSHSRAFDVELEPTQAYLKSMDDLSKEQEPGSYSRSILKSMALVERELKEVASAHVEALWSWAERHYRWSAGRSLVSGWMGYPKSTDRHTASRVMVSLRTAKTEIIE